MEYIPGPSESVAKLLDFHEAYGRTIDVWKFNMSENPGDPTLGIVIVTTNPEWIKTLEGLTDKEVTLQRANAEESQPTKEVREERQYINTNEGRTWKPHAFKGRTDRWCEICNLPDRDPIHKP